MIKWCAFCQQYLGEFPPYESKEISHGMCKTCKETGLSWTKDQETRIRYLADLNKRIWEAGRSGIQSKMDELCEEGIQAGIRPIDMLFGFAGPLLVQVGELWAANQITIEEEHIFTASCERMIELISKSINQIESPSSERQKMLLCNVPGSQHDLGIRFVSLGMASLGISTTVMLGANSAAQIVQKSLEGGYNFVGLSISMASQVESLKQCLDFFAAEKDFKGMILVGGGAVGEGLTLPEYSAKLTVRLLTTLSFRADEMRTILRLP